MRTPPNTATSATRQAVRTFVRCLLFALGLSGVGFAVLAAASNADEVLATLTGHHGPVASTSRVKAPSLGSPADDAVVEAAPTFAWKPVKQAVKYEFQLSADEDFGSVVLGRAKGSFQTFNTYATINRALPDGRYFWKVRAIDKNDDAGPWSAPRSINKSWSERPQPLAPASGSTITYPSQPLVLRWSVVPHAWKYRVVVATDPSLASPVAQLDGPVEMAGNVFALPGTLPQGRYYWAVTALDAQEHTGARSAVSSFVWSWPSKVGAANVTDLDADPRVFDPQLSWSAVWGAAAYDVEINSSQDWATGSKVCCKDATIGTSLSPTKVLPNNHYYWRVRAIDLDGNAGEWTVGPEFDKDFDHVTPTIPGLALHDNEGNTLSPGDPTSAPVIVWDTVLGAASYEVDVVPYEFGACNWTSDDPTNRWKEIKTATTAWTPLGRSWNNQLPGGVSYPSASYDGIKSLVDGQPYCARVLARSDRDSKSGEVVSDWTQLGGVGNPAFTYDAPTFSPTPPNGILAMPAANYNAPISGTLTTRTPYFTWSAVPDARSYFVVVSKDASFTDIVDVGFTYVPAYAPRKGPVYNPKTYPDETTTYYWCVMPAKDSNGGNVTTFPYQDNPQTLQKRSTPPTLLGPADGSDVTTPPTFRWTAAEGARNYRLQVAQDASFSNLVDDVMTAASSYTSSTTYPADTVLYWRVRANDETGIGLSWSAPRTFQRRLFAPVPSSGNPTDGSTAPLLTWSPVQGATSYDFHIEQTDGREREFRMGSTAGSFVYFYGTGVMRWSVRARFPTGVHTETAGPYSDVQSFTKRIEAPTGASQVNSPHHMLMTWNPNPHVKEYRVQVSSTDSFSRLVENTTTDNTNYAPDLHKRDYADGGTFYWRVAAMDEGRNQGAWTTRSLKTLRAMKVRIQGSVRKKRKGVVTVTVTDTKRHPLRRARVRVTGAGVRMKPKRTGKKGVVRFKVKPRKKGRIVVRAVKGGFRPGKAAVKVR